MVLQAQSSKAAKEVAGYVVGARAYGDTVHLTWESAWLGARLLGLSEPVAPVGVAVGLPGLAEYKALGLQDKLRPYQREAVRWLTRRAYGILGDPMRSGKSRVLIAAAIATGARRVLICCPALAKWVWADEIAKVTGQQSLILEGRAADVARLNCRVCWGLAMAGDVPCAACKGRSGTSLGVRVFRNADSLEEVCWRIVGSRPGNRAGTSQLVWDALAKLLLKDGEVALADVVELTGLERDAVQGALQRMEKDLRVERAVRAVALPDVHAAIEASRWVIVNYDILTGQVDEDAVGRSVRRDDLPGWVDVLLAHQWWVAIGDESHLLRGRPTQGRKRRGMTRREKFKAAVAAVPRVWLATGTPIFGFVRDLWGQLDACSAGLWSSAAWDGKWYDFDEAYCCGAHGRYGWRADGRSLRADNELVRRLRGNGRPEDAPVLLKRPRSLILADMPKKQRQWVRLDAPVGHAMGGVWASLLSGDESQASGSFKTAAEQTFAVKVDAVVDNVLGQLAEGAGAVVFTYHRAHAEKMRDALRVAMEGKEWGHVMRARRAELWLAHGGMGDETRVALCAGFRKHVEHHAGVFVATIDSVGVAVSLFGATSVHFVDLHWSPAALFQAEDRPYAPGVKGLTIIYYVVRGSVDEHVEAVVTPKIEHLQRMMDEEQADEILLSVKSSEAKLTMDEVAERIARMSRE